MALESRRAECRVPRAQVVASRVQGLRARTAWRVLRAAPFPPESTALLAVAAPPAARTTERDWRR